MRKVTEQTATYFNTNGQYGKAKVSNTEVDFMAYYSGAPANQHDVILYSLHGNVIACKERQTGRLFITNCGWQSNTTKERLNAIKGVNIHQKNFVWYLNGKEWDGRWVEIK